MQPRTVGETYVDAGRGKVDPSSRLCCQPAKQVVHLIGINRAPGIYELSGAFHPHVATAVDHDLSDRAIRAELVQRPKAIDSSLYLRDDCLAPGLGSKGRYFCDEFAHTRGELTDCDHIVRVVLLPECFVNDLYDGLI